MIHRAAAQLLRKYTTANMTAGVSTSPKYFDIGFNISDHMFRGIYHEKQQHESDIPNILNRCVLTNVKKLLITGSSIKESQHSIDVVSQFASSTPVSLYYTIGVHPCHVNEFVPEHGQSYWKPDQTEEAPFEIVDHAFTQGKLRELYDLYKRQEASDAGRFKAIGEIGLDYDRLNYSGIAIQKLFFLEQLKLSCFFPNKPLFLHLRSCTEDFMEILEMFIKGFNDTKDTFNYKELIDGTVAGGPRINEDGSIFYKFTDTRKFVVHSFTGSVSDLRKLRDSSENCYFSVNGCSMRTEESIEMISTMPLDRLLLETDAPWCDIRRTHASFKFLNKSCDATIADSWDHGLSDAYPQLDSWFKSVKKEKLRGIEREKWDEYMVKSRNEPCTMGHVATAVANIKGVPLFELVDQVWHNSCLVFDVESH